MAGNLDRKATCMVLVLGRSPGKVCGQELSKWNMAVEVRQDALEDEAYFRLWCALGGILVTEMRSHMV